MSDSTSDSNGSSVTSGASTLVGKRIGDYQILRSLGRGGMAEVYAAKHLSLDRKVALKVLRRDLANDQDYIKRFRREAKAAARLSHPNIVGVFDVGSVDGLHFIAQEFIDGPNLQKLLEQSGPVNTNDAIDILTSVALALDQAQQAGITHRDIKPENLIRSEHGEIKVADFGLARTTSNESDSQANLTQVGVTLGTPKYMSPEQLQGKPVDTRSDLYSLGVTMYHLLCGKAPFHAEDPLAIAVMHLHETAEPIDRVRGALDSKGDPDLPEWLIAIVDRLMSKSPSDRFQMPMELLDAIRSGASGSSSENQTLKLAGATVRLQRAADQRHRWQRSRSFQWVARIGIPLASAGVAYALLIQLPPRDATFLIKPAKVAESESIEEQYLIAVTRDDEAGWRAVSKYFPSSGQTKLAKLHRKANVQLARLRVRQGRTAEAMKLLDQVLSDPEASLLDQTIALASECLIRHESGKPQRSESDLSQLQSLYRELVETNPGAMETVHLIFPQAVRLRLGLEQ